MVLNVTSGDVNAAVSHGIFVFEYGSKPPVESLVEVSGKVADYQPDENARPTTQLVAKKTRLLEPYGPPVKPVWLTAQNVLVPANELAAFLEERIDTICRKRSA